MKASWMALALWAVSMVSIAAETPVPDTALEQDIYPRWSAVGDWHVTHPFWTDVVSFREDGTISTQKQGTTGRWVLTADQGTPLLVLRWDAFGTESLMMVDQNHFRGQIQPGSFMDMRRVRNSRAKAGGALR